MLSILCVGHAVQDLLFQVDSIPKTAEKHGASDCQWVGGGPAANAAVAIRRLGANAQVAARVGEDLIGNAIIDDLGNEGVDCSLLKKFAGCKSSLSAVLVDTEGQRLIVNYLAHDMPESNEWLARDFPAELDAVLADTRWPRGAMLALERARSMGIPGILDADYPIPAEPDLLRAASHVAFSAQGLSQRSGQSDWRQGLESQAADLDAWCCVTDGSRGVLTCDGGETVHIPAYPIVAVDTLAAGDIWHGAFAFDVCRGASEIDAVRFANAAAALKVSRPGGRNGAPTLAEVEAFRRRQEASEN